MEQLILNMDSQEGEAGGPCNVKVAFFNSTSGFCLKTQS